MSRAARYAVSCGEAAPESHCATSSRLTSSISASACSPPSVWTARCMVRIFAFIGGSCPAPAPPELTEIKKACSPAPSPGGDALPAELGAEEPGALVRGIAQPLLDPQAEIDVRRERVGHADHALADARAGGGIGIGVPAEVEHQLDVRADRP